LPERGKTKFGLKTFTFCFFMAQDSYQQMRKDVQNLLPVSESAVAIFEHSFPKVLALVNEKFALEIKFLGKTVTSDQMYMVRDAHKRFGELLLAVYEFNLYDHLIDELSWYICVLSSRGFERDYFDAMIKTWNIAIHSVISPPESHELARPLEWLHQNLSLIYKCRSTVGVQKSDELEKFLDFLLTKKRREAADYILSLIRQTFSVESLYSHLLPTALREIGRRWQENEMSVVDVHIATDICRYTIMRIADSITIEAELPYNALVSCVPGEEHEMGAEIVENYLEIKGWQVNSMGHIAPQGDIIKAIVSNKPDVVFLSITLVSNLPAAKALMLEIREREPEVKIVTGGHASVIASDALKNFSDAIVSSIEEGHTISLKLIGSHA